MVNSMTSSTGWARLPVFALVSRSMIFCKLCDFAAKLAAFSPEVRMRLACPVAVPLLGVLLSFVCVDGFAQQKPADAKGAVQTHLNRAADAVLALKSTRFSVKRE